MPVIKRGVSSISKSASAQLKGDVTLSEGANITLTQSGNDIAIAGSAGAGDTIAPATNSADYVPQWDGADSKTLKNGYPINATPTANNIPVLDAVGGIPYLAELGGWEYPAVTPTYASASTITVPSGAASIYQKGDRVRFKQGAGYKYYVIVGVADTVLTFAVNTDYTVANSAITDFYYSHQANPLGYPGWFSFTPSIAYTGGSAPTSPTAQKCKFYIVGTSITVNLFVTYGGAGSGNTSAALTLPVASVGNYYAAYGYLTAAALKRGYVTATTLVLETASVATDTFAAFSTYEF